MVPRRGMMHLDYKFVPVTRAPRYVSLAYRQPVEFRRQGGTPIPATRGQECFDDLRRGSLQLALRIRGSESGDKLPQLCQITARLGRGSR